MNATMDDLIKNNTRAFYTFDIGVLKQRINFLKEHLPQNASLCYAVKANPFILKEAAAELERIEVCSPGESEVCTALEIPKNKMVISGVYKSADYIEKMIADFDFTGVFTVESLGQFQMLCALSSKYQRRINLLLRLTNGSQFGINESDIEEIVKNKDRYPLLCIDGIQYFSGTQKTSLKKLQREISHLDDFLIRLRDELGFSAQTLEYGPGFPVSYFEGEAFDEIDYLTRFSEMLEDMSFRVPVILEVGRSIAASCGKYYTHIVDTKHNKGMNYAIVDGGMHHIVYFGQQMAMKRPRLSVNGKAEVNPEKTWTICGSLCSMNDMLAKQIPLPSIEIGDVLCFEHVGAYCMTEGAALFLSRDLPAIYIINENGQLSCVRKSFETYQLNTSQKERK